MRIPADALELAKHIVETKRGHFHPEKFEDRYETALKELIKRRAKGEHIAPEPEEKPDNVINLMDALKRSLAGEHGAGKQKEPAAKPTKKKPPARPGSAAKRERDDCAPEPKPQDVRRDGAGHPD